MGEGLQGQSATRLLGRTPPEAQADGEGSLPASRLLVGTPPDAKAEGEGLQGTPVRGHHDSVVDDASFVHVPSFEGFKGEEARESLLSDYRLPEHVVQVLNTRTATVHLSEGDGCWCRSWKCGSRESPAATAEFASTSGRWSHLNKVAFCLNCHSVKTVLRMGGALVDNGSPVEPSSSSSSESSSGSGEDSE